MSNRPPMYGFRPPLVSKLWPALSNADWPDVEHEDPTLCAAKDPNYTTYTCLYGSAWTVDSKKMHWSELAHRLRKVLGRYYSVPYGPKSLSW
jgi:hypothetical protein